jgi:transcriptional regulator with XRE-family HTH domain
MSEQRPYGERVRAARVDRGLSQRGLAAVLGISQKHVLDIEHGRRTPGPTLAGSIRVALGVPFAKARKADPREADLRLAVGQLLDAADRMRLGVTIPAEEWDALRDFATMVLASA